MKTVIIGNGILGLTTALRVALRSKPTDKVVVVGKFSRPGSATNAAAAMLNSFCEVEAGALENELDLYRFELSYNAAKMWPNFVLDHLEVAVGHNCLIHECKNCMGSTGACFELGTYLINNCSTDSLDDENYDAVIKALQDFIEPYSEVRVSDIPNYNPEARNRASRAIYIPNEGWLNPKLTLKSIQESLKGFDCIEFIDDEVQLLLKDSQKLTSVKLSNGKNIEGDVFLLATGASCSKLIDDSNLGISIPQIFNGVGVSIQISSPDYPHTKAIRTPNRGLACGLYTVPFYTGPDKPLNDIIVGASSFITSAPNKGARVGSVQSLLKGAMEQINVNFYKAEVSCINVGYRPVSADTYPVVGRSSISNLIIATGTKRDGFEVFSPNRSLIRNLTREEAVNNGVKHLISASYQHGFEPSHDRLLEKIKRFHRDDLERLHDKVGAFDWGIPPELIDLYANGYL